MIDTYLLEYLLPVELMISLFAIIVGYFVIKLPSSFKIKFALIPLLVVGSFFVFMWFKNTIGYPAHMLLSEEVVILQHRITKHDDDKKFIELWVLPVKDFSRSRLVAIPWTKEQEEKLRQVEQQKKKGGGIVIATPRDKRKGTKRRQGNEDVLHLDFKLLKPEILAPKKP